LVVETDGGCFKNVKLNIYATMNDISGLKSQALARLKLNHPSKRTRSMSLSQAPAMPS
jgi:hypothetical protein